MLQDLNQQEFKQFIWQLEYSDIGEGRERIPSSKLENSDMFDLVNQMWKTYIQQSVEVTMKVLKQIDRNDLVQILSVTSSGSKGKLWNKQTVNPCVVFPSTMNMLSIQVKREFEFCVLFPAFE